MGVCVLSHSVMSDSLQPHGLQPPRLLCPWDSPGKNTGVVCISSSRVSSQPRDQTCVSCIRGKSLTRWDNQTIYLPVIYSVYLLSLIYLSCIPSSIYISKSIIYHLVCLLSPIYPLSIYWYIIYLSFLLSVYHLCLSLYLPFNVSIYPYLSIIFSSVAQSCPILCNPMDCSTPGLPVHHQLPELAQTHVHQVVMSSNHLISVIPFSCLQSSKHQGLFQWVISSHQVAKVLEFQFQHQSFQWIFRVDFL